MKDHNCRKQPSLGMLDEGQLNVPQNVFSYSFVLSLGLVDGKDRKYRSFCMLIKELGVVASYLRSEGAALHSPTWLGTGRLRATFVLLNNIRNLPIVKNNYLLFLFRCLFSLCRALKVDCIVR